MSYRFKNISSSVQARAKSAPMRIGRKARTMSLQKVVKRIINSDAEHKEFTTTFTGNMTTNGTVTDIASIVQGVDIVNRVGRHIRWNSITCKLQFTPAATGVMTSFTGSQYDSGVFYVILDRQPNSATTTYPIVFDTSNTTTASAFIAHRNSAETGKRFLILHKEQCSISTAGPLIDHREFHVDLSKRSDRDMICEYLNAATAIPETNSIIVAYGDEEQFSAGVNIGMSILYNIKLRFTDV